MGALLRLERRDVGRRVRAGEVAAAHHHRDLIAVRGLREAEQLAAGAVELISDAAERLGDRALRYAARVSAPQEASLQAQAIQLECAIDAPFARAVLHLPRRPQEWPLV